MRFILYLNFSVHKNFKFSFWCTLKSSKNNIKNVALKPYIALFLIYSANHLYAEKV